MGFQSQEGFRSGRGVVMGRNWLQQDGSVRQNNW